ALDPFRIANRYGLFAVMTRGRYEIEFQGSNGGQTWVAYPFRYKPQDPSKAPGIYAPYQPRFEWNLWFTTLAEERATGMWWNRQLMGLYAPVLERLPDGKAGVVQWPEPLPPHD